MSILIISMYLDYHADAVFWALEKSGVDVLKWTISDFPAEQGLSINISNEFVSFHASDWTKNGKGIVGDGKIDGGCDVVWNRRIGRPQISSGTKKSDKAFILSESEHARRGFINNICQNSTWINTDSANYKYNNKLSQLTLANNVGFIIPETLITNNPIDVKEFIKKHENVVYKAFTTPQWYDRKNKNIYTAMTTKIDLNDIHEMEESIKICPGIFQKYKNKKYEIRITVMGEKCIAVKLNSQDSEKSIIDWRAGNYDFSIEEIILPDYIYLKIMTFMKKSGLLFGCIDMIVDKDDNYIFLEINTSGQFLWIEAINPEINMLSEFCKFILNNSNYNTEICSTQINLEKFSSTEISKFSLGESKEKYNKNKARYQNNTVFKE
ncbi:MAG: hypothetical protein HEQ34_13145 [Sphingorhabdus sp.]|uniref:hypothetical protein n=1 Tax=Sphingorhabdus sp. TaxID=1902408 RepID=UPI0025D4EA10|nr:hypothetical protein [Sphingorhabdus sp.]MCO4092879.1 hypothetical protein [Sphingorhabdus sp.]